MTDEEIAEEAILLARLYEESTPCDLDGDDLADVEPEGTLSPGRHRVPATLPAGSGGVLVVTRVLEVWSLRNHYRHHSSQGCSRSEPGVPLGVVFVTAPRTEQR